MGESLLDRSGLLASGTHTCSSCLYMIRLSNILVSIGEGTESLLLAKKLQITAASYGQVGFLWGYRSLVGS